MWTAFCFSTLLFYVSIFLKHIVFGKHTDSFNFLFSLSSKVPHLSLFGGALTLRRWERRGQHKRYIAGWERANWTGQKNSVSYVNIVNRQVLLAYDCVQLSLVQVWEAHGCNRNGQSLKKEKMGGQPLYRPLPASALVVYLSQSFGSGYFCCLDQFCSPPQQDLLLNEVK